MKSMRYTPIFLLFIILAGMIAGATAQTTDTHPMRGFMPNMEQLSSPVDNIDIASGKLNLQIPLASLPRGKGGSGYDLNLTYDSHIYDMSVNYIGPGDTWELLNATSTGGWNYNANNAGIEIERRPYVNETASCPATDYNHVRYRVILPDGSMHILYLKGYESKSDHQAYYGIEMNGAINACSAAHGYALPADGKLIYYTTDGSYLKYEVIISSNPTGTLYFPDGRRWVIGPNSVVQYDANGNSITRQTFCDDACDNVYTTITDQNNKQIVIQHNVASAVQESDSWRRDFVTAPGPNGNVLYTIDWHLINTGAKTIYSYYYYDDESHIESTESTINKSHWAVKYIHLPNPAVSANPPVLGNPPQQAAYSYKFGYWDDSAVFDDLEQTPNSNGSGWGMLNYMQMPSGARYYYKYSSSIEQPRTLNTIPEIAFSTQVEEKKVVADGVQKTWKWSELYNYASHRRIEFPDGHYTEYTIYTQGLISKICHGILPWNQYNSRYGEEIQRFWTHVESPISVWINYKLSKEIVSIRNAGGTLTRSAIADFSYDKNGNLKEKIEYDWVDYGVQTGSSVKRKTTYDYYVPATGSTGDLANSYWYAHNTNLWPVGTSRRLNALKRQTIMEPDLANPGLWKNRAATEYEYDYPYSKGNVTNEIRWDNTRVSALPAVGVGDQLTLPQAQSVVATYAYDSYGNVTDKYEAGTQTHITYDSTSSLVTQVDTAYGANVQRSVQYNWLNGIALTSTRDVNNDLTTYYTYDNVGRKISVNEAGLRQTSTIYDDVNRKVTVKGDLKNFGDEKLQSITHYDQLGRVKLTQKSDGYPLASDTDGIKVNTYYNELLYDYQNLARIGKQVITTSPYRSSTDTTLEWACTQYDLLGRVTAVATFNGSAPATLPTVKCEEIPNATGIALTSYTADNDGSVVTVTDPAGKSRKQVTDVLGNLVKVVEDPNGAGHVTNYTYDILGNLTQVLQGVQTRTFAYSSLSRLLTANNPESGAVAYTYYDNGDLHTKTDVLNKTMTMTYDPLHRILSKTYSDDTPAVNYEYHLSGTSAAPNIGQLKSVSSSVASTTYLYNPLGQVMTSINTINGLSQTPAFGYDYYLNGAVKSERYPSGKLVNYDVDDAGRTNKAYTTSTTYADMTVTGSTNPFTADGRIVQMRMGNNLWETYDYRNPGTGTSYKLGTTQGGGEKTQLEYVFHTTQNNGNVQNQTIRRGAGNTWIQSYTYDALNRLSTVSESSGGTWSQTYGYDQYGNRYISDNTNMPPIATEPVSLSQFTAANNRLTTLGGTTISYNAVGNQSTYKTLTNTFGLEYDAENRQKAVTLSGIPQVTYAYDGDGRRVKKMLNGGATTWFVYDALGQLAEEYSTQAPASTGTSYMFTDMLGSVRTITDSTGAVVENYDYLPFGRMLKATDNGRTAAGYYPADPDNALSSRTPQKFTGKERDAETGLDYFDARYYSAAQGKFLTPDPDNYDARQIEPQSWNMYTYTWNNPLRLVDKDGRAVNLAAAGVGAGIGYLMSFGGDAFSQYLEGGSVDWGHAAKSGVGGAISGATAGFTCGLSLVGVGGSIAASAFGNVAGGMVSRGFNNDGVLNAGKIADDFGYGAIGGAVGVAAHGIAVLNKLPAKPKPLHNVKAIKRYQAYLRKQWQKRFEELQEKFSHVGTVASSIVSDLLAPISQIRPEMSPYSGSGYAYGYDPFMIFDIIIMNNRVPDASVESSWEIKEINPKKK